MESVMEQIRTRLQAGETPQELIKKGFKRTSVYSVAKKTKQKEQANNDKSADRDLFLALLIRTVIDGVFDRLNSRIDPAQEFDTDMKIAQETFEELLGRKPPIDFLAPVLKTPK